MRVLILSLFLVFIVNLAARAATAATTNGMTAILSLKKGGEVSSADLQKLMKNREVVSSRDLFLPGEKDILKSIHAEYLAKAWLLEFKNEKSFDALEKQIRRQGLPLNLDWNDLKVTHQSADPLAGLQWGLKNVGVPQAIDLDPMIAYKIQGRAGEDIHLPADVTASKKVLVAVLDTGIDKTHPDLASVIHRNEGECKALAKFLKCTEDGKREECEKTWFDLKNPEVDTDHNGYPLDCQGWSLDGGHVNGANIMGAPDFSDQQGHGTHVAGIIGAQVGNGLGGRGVSPNVEILPVQVLGQGPSEPMKPLSVGIDPVETGREAIKRSLGDLVARGVIYAIHSGAKVINFSMGWPEANDSQFMRAVIAEAQAHGIIVVAAAGNDSTRALLRPCAYPGVICVGAAGPDGSAAHFSNHGSGVDIVAPGVNILSTYPMEVRPVRYRDTLGWEYLSGTSQATPIVTGAIAEMLARGVPAAEIYPRLILSSRAAPEKLPLLEGMPHEKGQVMPLDRELYKKISVGGNLDLSGALKALPQPLIVADAKEKKEIVWDRRSKNLSLEFTLRNYWQPVSDKAVQVRVSFPKPDAEAVRPTITGLQLIDGAGDVWTAGQTRKYRVTFAIDDAARPEDSRIPSELDLGIAVEITGMGKRLFVSPYEITVPVSEETLGDDVLSIPLQGMPKERTSILPIDENLDGGNQRDYLVETQNGKVRQLWIATQVGGQKDSPYVVRGGTKIRTTAEKDDTVREQVLARVDVTGDGRSEYVVGLFEDRSKATENTESPMTFHIFDTDMKLVDSFTYDSKMAQIPFQVYWMRVKGGHKMPAWVGGGKDPAKTRGLRERWENPTNQEKQDLRFYYLDENKNIKAVQTVPGQEGYKIIDVIEPRKDQARDGRVPVLMAKNMGTDAKPSYIYQFAVGEMIEGRVENFQEIDFFQDMRVYRNLLDTRVDKVQNLDPNGEENAGSFWFGEGLDKMQRLSILDNKTLDFNDSQLAAQRAQYDAALWVRAAFSGHARQGAFVLTNSEVQYHDLGSRQVVSSSFERYTFYPSMAQTNLYFPLVLQDSQRVDAKLPALFTTESSGLNRGVKMLVPVFAKSGRLVELVSPAKLRLKTAGTCRPLETPVFQGAEGHAFDYYCANKIMRIRLNF